VLAFPVGMDRTWLSSQSFAIIFPVSAGTHFRVVEAGQPLDSGSSSRKTVSVLFGRVELKTLRFLSGGSFASRPQKPPLLYPITVPNCSTLRVVTQPRADNGQAASGVILPKAALDPAAGTVAHLGPQAVWRLLGI
jgi:hypothetical protein